MRSRRISIRPNKQTSPSPISLGGWFQGKGTYLWIGDAEGRHCYGVISGHRLYRLAKAIVRHFEVEVLE